MIKFGKWIAKHKVIIVIISMLLLIPSFLGMAATRVNYDILSYLPESLETVEGQDIMVDEFGMGAFSMVVVEDMDMNGLRDLGDQLKEKLGSGVVVLASEKDGKVNLIAMATDAAMQKGAHAGNLIKGIAALVGGGGGQHLCTLLGGERRPRNTQLCHPRAHPLTHQKSIFGTAGVLAVQVGKLHTVAVGRGQGRAVDFENLHHLPPPLRTALRRWLPAMTVSSSSSPM